MKPILGVIALLAWTGRCNEIDLPHGNHHPPRDQSEVTKDAGTAPDFSALPDCLPDAATDPTEPPDAGLTSIDASEPELTDADVPDATDEPQIPPPPPPPPCAGPPGLYSPGGPCNESNLAPGIRKYIPKYQLWSDGADKTRYIYLPPGGKIDVANKDRWRFPVGTRLYKMFEQGGKRIETRVIEKVTEGVGFDTYDMIAYAWSEDQLDASTPVPDGVQNALGTQHDIPTQAQCRSCHNMAGTVNGTMVNLDAVNGFGALQLNWIGAGLALAELVSTDRFINTNPADGTLPTAAESHFPGSGTETPGEDLLAQNAFGYLHANCGHCHGGPNPRAGLVLWTTVATRTIEDSPLFATGACRAPVEGVATRGCLERWSGDTVAGGSYDYRFVPGHSELSGIVARMNSRVMGEKMPLLGTEVVDIAGVIAVSNFFDSLDMGTCDPTLSCPPPPPPMMMGGAGMTMGGTTPTTPTTPTPPASPAPSAP